MLNLFYILTLDQGYLEILMDVLSMLAILFGISVINNRNPIVSVLFLIGLFVSISLNLILLGYNFIGLSYLLVYVGAISILFLFILMLINVRISELANDPSNNIPLALFTSVCLGYPLYHLFTDVRTAINNLYKFNYSNKNDTMFIDLKEINKDSLLIEKNRLYDMDKCLTDKNFDLDNLVNETIYNLSIKDIKSGQTVSCENSTDFNIYSIEKNIKENIDVLQDMHERIHSVVGNSWDKNLLDFKDISSVGNVFYSTYGIWLIICSLILLLAMIGAITITKKEK